MNSQSISTHSDSNKNNPMNSIHTINHKNKKLGILSPSYPSKHSNIHSIQEFKQDLGAPKEIRFSKDSEIEKYKKVADNANKKQTGSNLSKLTDKKRVELLRNPAEFNAHTF